MSTPPRYAPQSKRDPESGCQPVHDEEVDAATRSYWAVRTQVITTPIPVDELTRRRWNGSAKKRSHERTET